MHVSETAEILRGYYSNDAVRSRIVEFLGGTFLDEASCAFVLGSNGSRLAQAPPRHPSDLAGCLDHGCEISRSLWDNRRLIAHLDIEYVNFDFPGEAYLNPHHMFQSQRAVVRAIQEVLLQWSISPLHVLTGRGHHFVWSIDRDSTAFRELADMGHVPDSLRCAYHQAHPPCGNHVDFELARAFAGLGLVIEFVAHRIKRQAAAHSAIPIQLTDVEVGTCGNGDRGREIISVDISEYADPLHTRHIRVPFSAYLKPECNREAVGDHVVNDMPLMFEIPLFEMSEFEAIDVMRDARRVAELARRASIRIPDQSVATRGLVAAYRSSDLSRFHEWFYDRDQHQPCEWANTYDRTPIGNFPSCVQHILEQPNDLLLKPGGIQHVVRVLMALGWHPRHIAGLIRSKYERDFGWGERWFRYDATNRADIYTRLFAGLIATGEDPLVDFNCVSNREKGYCFEFECGHNLADYRDSLTMRRNHERLGCRPFNRLFLSHEHL